jgi:hypothetical protein
VPVLEVQQAMELAGDSMRAALLIFHATVGVVAVGLFLHWWLRQR